MIAVDSKSCVVTFVLSEFNHTLKKAVVSLQNDILISYLYSYFYKRKLHRNNNYRILKTK